MKQRFIAYGSLLTTRNILTDYIRSGDLMRMEDLKLEKEIISILFVLRALIEGAK